jgi:hypothetical protein
MPRKADLLGANMTETFDTALLELDDYIRNRQAEARVADYEEDLFERALAERAPELAFRAGLGGTLHAMNARGTLDLWITQGQIAELRARGLNLVVFDVDPANPTTPEIPPTADLVIAKVPLDLTGVRRLDAEVLTDDGRLLKRMPDIDFDPAEGAIFTCCEAELARTAVAARRLTRLWASRESSDGRAERTLLLELRAV